MLKRFVHEAEIVHVRGSRYNSIDKFVGLEKASALKVLYMSNNNVKDWKEIDRLKGIVSSHHLFLSSLPILPTRPSSPLLFFPFLTFVL
jgi:hypothetical protein